jgi:HEAT repeat protein
MEIDEERQQRALKSARKIIEETERTLAARRLSRGIAEFAGGNFDILRSDELVIHLADHLFALLSQGKDEQASILLTSLSQCACCDEVLRRERAMVALSLLIGRLLEKEQLIIICRLSQLLVAWLQFETVCIVGFGVICKQIEQIGKILLANGLYADAEALLVVIHQIQSGILEREQAIRAMISKIQENLAAEEILEIIVDEYLHDVESRQSSIENLLVCLGRRAAIFLLNRLILSDGKKDHLLLLRLIPVTGTVIVPVLIECLKNDQPWFVTRNIISIIAGLGDPALSSLIQPSLGHPDIRVQQEALDCIVRLGGSRLKTSLLEALPIVDDELKIPLVSQLAEIGGEGVAEALRHLLPQEDRFAERVREELIVRIISALRKFPAQESVKALKQLIARSQGDPFRNRITAIAAETILYLEPKMRHERQQKTARQDINYDDDPREMVRANAIIRGMEEEIVSLIRQGDLDKACRIIYDRCVAAARDKDFLPAEMLRDRLLEINPLALSEVLAANEIIEEEKSSSLTGKDLKIWAELRETMGNGNFTAMHCAMHPEKYRAGEVIVGSGETDVSLFFINSGVVGMYCRSGSREIFLKRMQPGDILGSEQFFSVSAWTVTLKALSDVQMHVLDRRILADLQHDQPGFASRLQEFCMRFAIVPDLIGMAGDDRREYLRYPVSFLISVILFDPYGHAGRKTFKGEMTDLARGGLSFSIRISSLDNARLLLGRQIAMEIGPISGDVLRCGGIIVGARSHHLAPQGFSIHVKLFTKLEQAVVMAIAGESGKLPEC